MRECVWMEGRRCGRTLLEGPDYVIWTRASGWCCVAPSRPGKMLLGVRQHLCVSVLGHVFVRVCVTALRENKAWTKKQYHSMCSLNTREGEKGMWEGWKGKMRHGWVFIEMLRAGCSFIQMLVYYEMLQKLIPDQKCMGWLHEMWNNERVCISHVKRGAWGLSFPDVDVMLASRVLP